MRNIRIFELQIALILAFSGCSSAQQASGTKTAFGGKQEGAPERRVSQAELQDDLLRFESQFNAGVENANRDLESSSDAKIRYRAALNRLIYSTNSLGIATGPSPEANLLDMVTFIELSREVLEQYWIPEVFSSGGAALDQIFRQSAADVWGIANKVLGPKEKGVLQNYISTWRKNHPDQVNVETVRLSAFSYESGLEAEELSQIGGLFASVQQATEAADSARLFAERALYYAERAPTLLRLQAKLGAHEVLNEIGLSLGGFPSPVGHERELTALLVELQSTLRLMRATLGDANTTMKSVSDLYAQQVGHPEVARNTTEALAQLTILLREWSNLLSSADYRNGVSQMAGIASGVERHTNRLLLRFAWLGAVLIILFWLMALVSRLAFLRLSKHLDVQGARTHDKHGDEAASHDKHRDEAA